MNLCDDRRFATIEAAKMALIKGTNIEDSPEEMKVLDNILLRCWQMGWLDRYDQIKTIEPSTNCSEFPNNSDTISRAKAIEALDKRFDSIPIEQTSEILMLRKDLRDLPSAQSERIRGRWIPVGGALYQCDQCGVVSLKRKFCSECGADMRER